MEHYLVFILIAAAVIASPGPGIVLTLKNTLHYDFRGALPGIAGVALGMLLIAVISAAGLGILLTTSALAFTLLKYLGAAYLIYLGIKLWRSSGQVSDLSAGKRSSVRHRFCEGLGITALNPKPIIFFLSLFPQFIDPAVAYVPQFVLLALTFSALVVVIHCAYAGAANLARDKLRTPRGSEVINKVSGGVFVCFGLALTSSK